MFEIFTNRELAIVFWVSVIFVWILSKKQMRQHLKVFVKQLLQPVFLIPILLSVCYVQLVIISLEILTNFKALSSLKDIVIWFIVIIPSSMFYLVRLKEADENLYFKDFVWENIKITTTLQFILGLYQFPLWVEIIMLPIVTFIALLSIVSKSLNKDTQVTKSLDRLLICITVSIFTYTAWQVLMHFKEYFIKDNLIGYILPLMLSFFFLPFLYLWFVYCKYESVFAIINHQLKNNKPLLVYVKKQLLYKFNFKTKLLTKWKSSIGIYYLNTKDDIDKSIAEIIEQDVFQKSPPQIDETLGWSPYKAIHFLEKEGLNITDYKKHDENIWGAGSDSIKIPKQKFLPDRISYSVNGNKQVVNELILSLYVNDKSDDNDSKTLYNNTINKLLGAINITIPDIYTEKIFKTHNFTITIESIDIAFHKTIFKNNKGYNLSFQLIKSEPLT